MIHRNILITSVGFVALFASSGAARASCNSLPPASEIAVNNVPLEVVIDQGAGSSVPMGSSFQNAFRYKAALGRVDGVFFTPGPKENLRFAMDGLCVGDGTPGPAPRIMSMGPIDDLAIFIAFDAKAGLPTPIWPYAQQPSFPLDRLKAAMRELPPAPGSHGPTAVDFVLADWDPRVRSIPLDGQTNGLQIPVPSLARELEATHVDASGSNLASSSVRILAMHVGDKSPAALAGELAEFLQHDCAAICEKIKNRGAELCVDDIYTRRLSDDVLKEFPYARDEMLCSVDIPQPYFDNLFADICDPGLLNQNTTKVSVPPATSGSTPTPGNVLNAEVLDAQLKVCDPRTSTLRFWRSTCGGIHFPLDYSMIRVRDTLDGTKPTKVKRRLGGTSGVGRESDTDVRRIYVPGREFVGSTPQLDSSSRSPDVHWRLPELDVWYPDGQESNEFGLVGVADKDRSIVHVFPRMPATYVCGDPERGCMSVDSSGDHCACADTGLAGCTCTQLAIQGKFFACSGGDRENMPCTRDEHCKSRDTSRANGTCSRQPICRPEHTVWRRMRDGDPDSTGAISCNTDGECGSGEQCGYSLFDFRSRVDAVGWHELHRDVVLLQPPQRRGACAHDRDLSCSNAGTPGFPGVCPNANRCRGYRLAAGSELP